MYPTSWKYYGDGYCLCNTDAVLKITDVKNLSSVHCAPLSLKQWKQLIKCFDSGLSCYKFVQQIFKKGSASADDIRMICDQFEAKQKDIKIPDAIYANPSVTGLTFH